MKGFAALIAAAFCLSAQNSERPRPRPLPPASKDLKTGPEVGAKVPNFTLPDQTGRKRTLASLTGKNGLLLYFVRSADW